MLNVEDKAFIEGSRESASFMRAEGRSQEDKMTFCRPVDSTEWRHGNTLEHVFHVELPARSLFTAGFALPGWSSLDPSCNHNW